VERQIPLKVRFGFKYKSVNFKNLYLSDKSVSEGLFLHLLSGLGVYERVIYSFKVITKLVRAQK
jgi:hypothetical protein